MKAYVRKVDLEGLSPADPFIHLDHWRMKLPGHHALWDRFVMTAASLADHPNYPPAKKHFPEATHEVLVYAIDPEIPAEDWTSNTLIGGALEPMNHVVQVASTNEKVNAAMEVLAQEFLAGRQFAEPQGIMGARDRFERRLRELCAGT